MLGVFTKPDRIPTWRSQLGSLSFELEKKVLENNWYCVKQAAQLQQNKQNITWIDAGGRESDLFSPWLKLNSISKLSKNVQHSREVMFEPVGFGLFEVSS